MESLLVKDVTYSYRNKYQTVHALSGVSVEFKPGKMYAIIGASGCGKTTFLSLLAGLDVPETGSIKWAGEATATMDRDRYRRESVSVIYQNFNLFQHLTALENAAYPLYMRNMRKKAAESEAILCFRHLNHATTFFPVRVVIHSLRLSFCCGITRNCTAIISYQNICSQYACKENGNFYCVFV